ncbi:hypothetical protein ACXA45_11145 [Neomicrococcus lactis]
MGNLKRKVLGSLAAFGVVGGLAVGTAFPAEAGTSIPTTYNGGTRVYYKFNSTTNSFCVKQTVSSRHAPRVVFYGANGKVTLTIKARDVWDCLKLTNNIGLREGSRVRLGLSLLHKPYYTTEYRHVLGPSYGYVRI